MEAQENAQTQIRNMVGNHLLVAASSHAIGAAGQAVRGPETGAGVELGRDAELDLIRQRNDATAHVEASQLSQIAAAMNIGVDQRMMTGEHGGEVHVQFDRQGGRITGMTLRVGERVPLETVLGHIHAVRAMERYQGAVGILRNAIDHVRSLVRTGHFLSDGGREALFELEKLQPIVDRYVDLLSNTSMTEATRADVNAHRISLQEQIARQQERLNRTDPGLGYVASHEHVDSVGVGASAQPALDATATGDAVSTRLYRDNGEFWNPEIEDRYEAYRDRQRQAHPHREPSSRDRWIDTATRDGELQSALVTELGPGWRARRRTGRDRSPDHDASVGARREFSAGEDAAEIQALSDTRQSLREDARRIRERGVMSEADQSRRNAILQRMRDVSQRAGLLAADAYARREGFTERIYPGEGVPSRAGDFDRVYIRRTSTGTEILVLEAKGGRGTLGSAEFHGERYEQGSTGYLVRTIGTSPSRDLEVPYHPSAAFLAAHPEIESPLHITLNQAMRMAMEADRADGGHRLRYVLVEVPESRGGLASPRAADFELRPEGRRRGGE